MNQIVFDRFNSKRRFNGALSYSKRIGVFISHLASIIREHSGCRTDHAKHCFIEQASASIEQFHEILADCNIDETSLARVAEFRSRTRGAVDFQLVVAESIRLLEIVSDEFQEEDEVTYITAKWTALESPDANSMLMRLIAEIIHGASAELYRINGRSFA